MTNELSPIGMDSDEKHSQSEIDRINAIFTVATGSMGNQQVNYHLIDEERDRRTIGQSLPVTQLINQSSKETFSFQSLSIDPKVSENPTKKEVKSKIIDDPNREARFSLLEIDSSNQQENKYPIKKTKKLWQPLRKEQSIANPSILNLKEREHPATSFLHESAIDIPEHCRSNVNNKLQHQAESLLPFYTVTELAQHNHSTDAWICIFTQIYDITSLIKQIRGTLAYQQMIDYAGQDISSWFDEQTHEPRRRIDPQTHQPVLFIPILSIIEALGSPFWKTKDLLIGRLTQHSQYIRLLHNFSPKHPYVLEVTEEETIGQIARKFLKHNAHIFSYVWQYHGRILDLNKTLTENGIINEESFHDQYGWPSDDENCPTILLYFSDDLTIA